jgi:hypothetical protein
LTKEFKLNKFFLEEIKLWHQCKSAGTLAFDISGNAYREKDQAEITFWFLFNLTTSKQNYLHSQVNEQDVFVAVAYLLLLSF